MDVLNYGLSEDSERKYQKKRLVDSGRVLKGGRECSSKGVRTASVL